MGQSLLERTSASLARSQRAAAEAEEVGRETLADLAGQRESLERARGRLGEAEEGAARGRDTVRRIRCGALQNRAVLGVIIAAEALILACLVYLKFIK